MTDDANRADRLDGSSVRDSNVDTAMGSFSRHPDFYNYSGYNSSIESSGFFIKPVFCLTAKHDSHTFGGYTQKYLKILVENKGYGIADNCEATLRIIIPKGENIWKYPTDNYFDIVWGRDQEKKDVAPKIRINPRVGKAELHVIFTDSRFGDIPVRDAPPRIGSISTLKHLQAVDIPEAFAVEDCFSVGDFEAKLTITSHNGYCESKLLIHIDNNFLNSTIELSPWDRKKMKIKSLFL